MASKKTKPASQPAGQPPRREGRSLMRGYDAEPGYYTQHPICVRRDSRIIIKHRVGELRLDREIPPREDSIH